MTAQVYDPSRGVFSLVTQPVRFCETSAKVMVNGDSLFTVTGRVLIKALFSVCVTANNATASTLQYSYTTSLTATQTLSNASTTLASVAAGYLVSLDATTGLAEAVVQGTSGVAIVGMAAAGIHVPAGTLKAVIGVGSTTGTWKHYIAYEPLSADGNITAAF